MLCAGARLPGDRRSREALLTADGQRAEQALLRGRQQVALLMRLLLLLVMAVVREMVKVDLLDLLEDASFNGVEGAGGGGEGTEQHGSASVGSRRHRRATIAPHTDG